MLNAPLVGRRDSQLPLFRRDDAYRPPTKPPRPSSVTRHAAHRPAILASSGLSFELRQAPPFYPACALPAGGEDYTEYDLKSYGWVHIYFCKILFLFPSFHHQAMFSA